jgi:hypothetical protein
MRRMGWGLGLLLVALPAAAALAQSTEPSDATTLTAAQVYEDTLGTLVGGDQHGAEMILRQAVQTFSRDRNDPSV